MIETQKQRKMGLDKSPVPWLILQIPTAARFRLEVEPRTQNSAQSPVGVTVTTVREASSAASQDTLQQESGIRSGDGA